MTELFARQSIIYKISIKIHKLAILVSRPTEINSLAEIRPVPNTSAFGGVAVGNINAEFALNVIRKIQGSTSRCDSLIIMSDKGRPKEVTAVLLHNSVTELIINPNNANA